jgi:nicotinate-nucleotide adenylyltransferase
MTNSIAIYGGSFNPPTIAHYLLPKYLIAAGIVDNVMVMPSFIHPDGKELVDFDLRMKMCDAMFRNENRIFVSDVEKVLGGLSLSLRTVTHIVQKAPKGTTYRFVVGTDCYVNRAMWGEDWNTINGLAPFLYIPRNGYPGPCDLSDAPGIPEFIQVSSTQVRKSLKDQKMPSNLLHKNVVSLIEQERLYGYESELY